MSTLHLLPSVGHQTASELKRNASLAWEHMLSLRRALQSLEASWQGGVAREEFTSQTEVLLRNLEAQIEALQRLAERLEREVIEWEEVDQRGAAGFRGLSSVVTFTTRSGAFVTGGSNIPFVFTVLSIEPFLREIPAWLKAFLERFFPPTPSPISPVPDGSVGAKPSTPKRATEKASPSDRPQPAPSSARPAPSPSSSKSPAEGYDIYYRIPPKSQGRLYGSAACLPTSISMVTDYFHAKNPANKAVSPRTLIRMLDPGDGTPGKGIGFDRLNDDLAELGYQATVSKGDMPKLEATLKNGPVLVNVKVGLTSHPRDITPSGSYDHTVLVKGFNAKSVIINDPWSGKEKVLPRTTFEQIWNNGGKYMMVIRPRGVQ